MLLIFLLIDLPLPATASL